MATGPQSECLRLWEDLGFSFDVAKSYAPESEFRGGGGQVPGCIDMIFVSF